MLHSNGVAKVQRLENYPQFVWHSVLQEEHHDILTVSKIKGKMSALPEQFLPPTYAVEFVVRGTICGKINNTSVELKANDGAVIFADHILKTEKVSEDCELYVLGFTPLLVEELNLKVPLPQLAQLFMRPVWKIGEEKIGVLVRYFELLRDLLAEGNRLVIVSMLRSLMYYLLEEYSIDAKQSHQLTRSEEICGRFLSLVESYCRDHHRIDWYASELCLSSKYLSNLVKQTMGNTAGACIGEAIIRQAKSLLLSTTLPIQDIADRLGFCNQSHFGTFFHREVGMSPRTFRKRADIPSF